MPEEPLNLLYWLSVVTLNGVWRSWFLTGHLVLVAGPLTVLCDGLQGLPHQVYVALVDVQPQQAEAPRGAAADAVQELQRLTHQVVVGLVVLVAQVVLQGRTIKM